MDEKLRITLSKLFDDYCFILTEKGKIIPTYFIIKNHDIIRVKNIGLNENVYTSLVFTHADRQHADALVFLSEKKVVSADKDDRSMQALIDGQIGIEDHPDHKPYLILIYIGRNGDKEAIFGKIEKDPSGVKFIKNHEWANDIVAQ